MRLALKHHVHKKHQLLWTLITDQVLLWNMWSFILSLDLGTIGSLDLEKLILNSPWYCDHLLNAYLRHYLAISDLTLAKELRISYHTTWSHILLTTKFHFFCRHWSHLALEFSEQPQDGRPHLPTPGNPTVHQRDSRHEAVHHAGENLVCYYMDISAFKNGQLSFFSSFFSISHSGSEKPHCKLRPAGVHSLPARFWLQHWRNACPVHGAHGVPWSSRGACWFNCINRIVDVSFLFSNCLFHNSDEQNISRCWRRWFRHSASKQPATTLFVWVDHP